MIFAVFWTPFWGAFWHKYVKKWSMEKESKKESEKRAQGTRFAAEAGLSGGRGRLRLAALQVFVFAWHSARPATSDEVRRIYRLPPLPPTSYESQLV